MKRNNRSTEIQKVQRLNNSAKKNKAAEVELALIILFTTILAIVLGWLFKDLG